MKNKPRHEPIAVLRTKARVLGMRWSEVSPDRWDLYAADIGLYIREDSERKALRKGIKYWKQNAQKH